jgi:hypothetical protein
MKAVNGTLIRRAWHVRFPTYRSILLISEKVAALHAQGVLFQEHAILEAFSIFKQLMPDENRDLCAICWSPSDSDE